MVQDTVAGVMHLEPQKANAAFPDGASSMDSIALTWPPQLLTPVHKHQCRSQAQAECSGKDTLGCTPSVTERKGEAMHQCICVVVLVSKVCPNPQAAQVQPGRPAHVLAWTTHKDLHMRQPGFMACHVLTAATWSGLSEIPGTKYDPMLGSRRKWCSAAA